MRTMKFAFYFSIFIVLTRYSISYEAKKDTEIHKTWNDWCKKYIKNYDNINEKIKRFKIWQTNYEKINKFNNLHTKGFKIGLNKFSDLTYDEFSRLHLIPIRNKPIKKISKQARSVKKRNKTLPLAVDWVKRGAVNPVNSQELCNSCWAFSSLGSLEGAYFIKTRNLLKLSTQQLIDCNSDTNTACSGGMPEKSYSYMINYGLQTDNSYPYISGLTGQPNECKYNKSKVIVNVKRWSYTSKTSFSDENALTEAIAFKGPVAAPIYASELFQFYTDGIFHDDNCNLLDMSTSFPTPAVNHAILVVGYGIDEKTGQEFYRIRNEWGTDWGMNGYALIARNRNNSCQISSYASYAVLD